MNFCFLQSELFGSGFENSALLTARPDLVADMPKHSTNGQHPPPLMKPDSFYSGMGSHGPTGNSASDLPVVATSRSQHQMHPFQAHYMGNSGMHDQAMLDQLGAVANSLPTPHLSDHMQHQMMYSQAYSAQAPHPVGHPSFGSGAQHSSITHSSIQELDCDPRELEAFAERFKQRRIKLGVTQADVGKALGNLKLPGVGSLSQSTICRFESLTLSHNNMIALKPVLAAWLDEAERQARENNVTREIFHSAADRKRKRTSIAAPEKRSLEAYFAVQPRPSGEKIAQIADKLSLKKSVVRVWFCNQRQKQKRMKFAALGHLSNR